VAKVHPTAGVTTISEWTEEVVDSFWIADDEHADRIRE
jgi:hypothetical protein